MHRFWAIEFWRITLFLLGGLGLGALAGFPVIGMLSGTLVYLGFNLREIHRLECWLGSGGNQDPPESIGIWADIYLRLYGLQQRDRKRKRKLRKALTRFRKSSAALPDGVLMLNSAHEIEWMNDAATDLLDIKNPQDVGQKVSNLIRVPVFIEYLQDSSAFDDMEFNSPKRDELRLQARLVPFGKNDRLLVIRDVTRLHQLEKMRRDFVANASHELRTPLTVLSGYLESLTNLGDERFDTVVTTMRQQTLRMQHIIEDLLLLTRLEAQNDAPNITMKVPIALLLRDILTETQSLDTWSHRLVTHIDPNVQIAGNSNELRSAFSNLIHNAVQYTPDDGDITVTWQADNHGARFSVKDSGIGIEANHIPRLTERFYRVDTGRSRKTGGTGLGLSIVKHVLNRHGADLIIDSIPGEGSTFSCQFPDRIVEQPSMINNENHG